MAMIYDIVNPHMCHVLRPIFSYVKILKICTVILYLMHRSKKNVIGWKRFVFLSSLYA